MLFLPLFISLGIAVYGTENQGHQDPQCDCEFGYLKSYYKALGCRPVYKDNSYDQSPECRCPEKFDCTDQKEIYAFEDNEGSADDDGFEDDEGSADDPDCVDDEDTKIDEGSEDDEDNKDDKEDNRFVDDTGFNENDNTESSFMFEDDEVYGTEKQGHQLTKDPQCDCEFGYLISHYEALGCRPVYEENPDADNPECRCPKKFDCSDEKDYGKQNTTQQLTENEYCECQWRYLSHYEDLGCRPVYEENPNDENPKCKCPKRFDCPQVHKLNADGKACVYKNQVYLIGTEIPSRNPCEACFCNKQQFSSDATIDCEHRLCARHLNPVPEGCHNVYTENECCPKSVECPAEENGNFSKVPICEYKGKRYHEGQRFSPDEDPCLTCLCDSNWTGIDRTSCWQGSCMLDMLQYVYGKLVKGGCIPIYHEETCCPIYYECPERNFEVNTGPSFKSVIDTDEMCHFEGQYYPIGHALDIDCVRCSCKTPPTFTCIYYSCPGPPNDDYENCTAHDKPNACCPYYKCYDKKACLYRKQFYLVGTDIPTTNPCEKCFCRAPYDGNSATMECIYEECPSVFPLPEGCHRVYTKNKCCPTGVKCDNDIPIPDQLLTKDRICDCDWRDLQHYKDRGCRPVYDEKPGRRKGDCTCPLRFDCSGAMYSNETACVYKKQLYSVGTRIPTTDRCRECSCIEDIFKAPKIHCGPSACPSNEEDLPYLCHYVYTENKCCPTSVRCLDNEEEEEEDSLEVHICEYEDERYYEGQYIEIGRCLICLCNSNWNGINSTSCRQQYCDDDLNSWMMYAGCIPIYYGNDCCPIDYICPGYFQTLDYTVFVRESSIRSENDKDEMCHFEGLYYPVGHVLGFKGEDHCVICTCKIPPDFTCIRNSCPVSPEYNRYRSCRTVKRLHECCDKVICDKMNGISYDPHECIEEEREKCNHDLVPKDYPETAEELRNMCDDFTDYARCMLNVHSNCQYSENLLYQMKKRVNFITTTCEEDDPFYKVISNNLECITPIARKFEETCNPILFSEENLLIKASHEDEILNNSKLRDTFECLQPFWFISCRSITLGLHCGSEVKEVVNTILMHINDRYENCKWEFLRELQPLLKTYERVLESEQKLKNAL